jgi:hypothetical protein
VSLSNTNYGSISHRLGDMNVVSNGSCVINKVQYLVPDHTGSDRKRFWCSGLFWCEAWLIDGDLKTLTNVHFSLPTIGLNRHFTNLTDLYSTF